MYVYVCVCAWVWVYVTRHAGPAPCLGTATVKCVTLPQARSIVLPRWLPTGEDRDASVRGQLECAVWRRMERINGLHVAMYMNMPITPPAMSLPISDGAAAEEPLSLRNHLSLKHCCQ